MSRGRIARQAFAMLCNMMAALFDWLARKAW